MTGGSLPTKRSTRPRIALAMGDPAGIGPEILIKALREKEVRDACVPVVIGDARLLGRAPGWGPDGPMIQLVSGAAEATREEGVIPLLDLGNVPDGLAPGVV